MDGKRQTASNLNNFKGIYYNESDGDQKLFEFGSHFNYKNLCRKLERLVKEISPERRGKSLYEDSPIEKTFNITRETYGKSKDFYLKDSINHLSKLSETINLKNVCDNINQCLNKKTSSFNGKVVSELSNKERIETPGQGNIILNSIININITNINNPRNPTLTNPNESKCVINKTLSKINEKYKNQSTTSKFLKYMSNKEEPVTKRNNKSSNLSGSYNTNNQINLTNHFKKNSQLDNQKGGKVEVNNQIKSSKANLSEAKFSPTSKKFLLRDKLFKKELTKKPENSYVFNTNSTKDNIQINSGKSKINIPSVSMNSNLQTSFNYNSNQEKKSRNVNRPHDSKFENSKVSTVKSKSQHKLLINTVESKKTIEKSKEKPQISINKKQPQSKYNLFKNACTSKPMKDLSGRKNKLSLNNDLSKHSKYSLNESNNLNFKK